MTNNYNFVTLSTICCTPFIRDCRRVCLFGHAAHLNNQEHCALFIKLNNEMSLQTVDVSQARKKLSNLMNAVFFEQQNFVLTRRGIPMAQLMPVAEPKLPYKKANIKNIDTALFGIWKKKKEKTATLAKKLRKTAWER